MHERNSSHEGINPNVRKFNTLIDLKFIEAPYWYATINPLNPYIESIDLDPSHLKFETLDNILRVGHLIRLEKPLPGKDMLALENRSFDGGTISILNPAADTTKDAHIIYHVRNGLLLRNDGTQTITNPLDNMESEIVSFNEADIPTIAMHPTKYPLVGESEFVQLYDWVLKSRPIRPI